MKNKRIVLYYNIILILIILIGISSFFMTYFYNLRDTSLRIREMIINESSEISYALKENNNETFIYDKDIFNISDIDKVNTSFNYVLTFGSEVYGEYSYYIKGYEIYGKSLKREVYKSDLKKYELTGNVININTNFNIEVNKQLESINAYKNANNILDDTSIYYEIIVNYSVFSDKLNKSLIEKKIMFINVPVSEHAKISNTNNIQKSIVEYSTISAKDNELYVIICLEFLGAIIMFTLIVIIMLKKIDYETDDYTVRLEKILKKYGNLIVHVDELPDLSKMEVLFVQDIEDLKDAAVNLNQVINYTDVIVNKAATFIVMNKKIAYVYKLTR